MTDKIKPIHYKNKDGSDLLDIMYQENGIEYIRIACDFNIKKYTCRAGKKDNEAEKDAMKKANEYKRRLEEFEKLENE